MSHFIKCRRVTNGYQQRDILLNIDKVVTIEGLGDECFVYFKLPADDDDTTDVFIVVGHRLDELQELIAAATTPDTYVSREERRMIEMMQVSNER